MFSRPHTDVYGYRISTTLVLLSQQRVRNVNCETHLDQIQFREEIRLDNEQLIQVCKTIEKESHFTRPTFHAYDPDCFVVASARAKLTLNVQRLWLSNTRRC